TMATRIELILALLDLSVPARLRALSSVRTGRTTGSFGCRAGDPALGVDQPVQPTDLALDLLESVTLQLEGVVVEPFTGPGSRLAYLLQPLGESGAAPFQDPHPGLSIGLGEQREAHTEVLVLPRRRSGTREHLRQ